MLTQKKRRRKRKKSAIPISTIQTHQAVKLKSSHIDAAATVLPVPKLRLSKAFLKEETDIQNAIVAHCGKANKIDNQSVNKLDTDTAFFSDRIFVADFDVPSTVDQAITPSSDKTTDQDGQQLASSYVQIDDESVVHTWTKETVTCNGDGLLYYPDAAVGLVEDDSESARQLQSRDLSNEGLFVHAKAYHMRERNTIFLVNRFIEEGSTEKWLERSALNGALEIRGLRNFVDDTNLYRSKTKHAFEPTECLRSVQANEIATNTYTVGDRILRIHISDVDFSTHPSFTKEYMFAKRLEFLYAQYAERKQEHTIEKLENRLESLRHLLKDTESSGDQSTQNRLRDDLRDARNLVYREGKFDRQLMHSLLEQWRSLKQLREKQGFNRTAIRVVIKTEEADAASDRCRWNAKFELELKEIFEDAMSIYYKQQGDRRRILEGSVDEESAEVLQKISKPDVEEISDNLRRIYMESMRHPGEAIVSIELEKLSVSGEKSEKVAQNKSDYWFVFQAMFDDQKVGSIRRCLEFGAGSGLMNVNAMFSVKLTRKMPNKMVIYVS